MIVQLSRTHAQQRFFYVVTSVIKSLYNYPRTERKVSGESLGVVAFVSESRRTRTHLEGDVLVAVVAEVAAEGMVLQQKTKDCRPAQ